MYRIAPETIQEKLFAFEWIYFAGTMDVSAQWALNVEH